MCLTDCHHYCRSATAAPAAKPTPKTEGSVSSILLQWCKQHTKGFEYKVHTYSMHNGIQYTYLYFNRDHHGH